MKEIIIIGLCPICDREMWVGESVNKHHFVPKSRGGKETTFLHKVCHSKIHSLFTEPQLEQLYYTPELLKENEEIQKFVKWVSKKDPDFYDRSVRSNTKHRPKR